MRRLGIFLVLAACAPPSSGSDAGNESTTSGVDSSSSSDSGVHTVTGWEPSTEDAEETVAPPHTEPSAADDTTSTTAAPPDTDPADTDTTGPANVKECGNGVVEGDELCDDGNQDNTDNCTINCTVPYCGDELLGPGEVCDDGNQLDNDACLSDCSAADCGDGVVWDGEETCDDGNAIETDACLPDCKAAYCGDGVIWAGHETCDDGFNDNSYNSCKPGCQGKADTYCGDGKLQAASEHCDGSTGMANVTCVSCLFDFSQITQMACAGSCSWGPSAGCGQDDADIFCRLRTGNASAKALSWKTAPPTALGGFPCADPDVFINQNGKDPRKWLGALPAFGVSKNAVWQALDIKGTHGNSPVLQAADVVCDG